MYLENKPLVQRKMKHAFLKDSAFGVLKDWVSVLLRNIQTKSKDKSPRWMWLSLMPFDASDMFVKAKIHLCIEVIIFQFFVWEVTEPMVFFKNSYWTFHIAITIWSFILLQKRKCTII